MSTACTKDDVCKFFDFQVNDTAKWTDKCGSERYLGDTCKPQCCNQQNEHCFKSQTAAYQTMRFYNQCMEQRGCKDEATCDSFFATGTDGQSRTGIQFNYDVVPSLEKSLCGNEWNGGSKCKEQCCSTQWNYCSTKASIGEVHTLFDCMAERGCLDYATKEVNGEDGKQCNVGSLNFFINPDWTDDNYKCGGTRQGNASCNDQCCAKNIKHCTGACATDTDPDACITRCTKARNCNEELSCSDYTFNVNPSDSSKCGEDGRGGETCKEDCCSKQWNYCKNSAGITDVHTLFDCMAERGCMKYATKEVNGEDGKQCNVGSLNFSINPNWTDNNYKCGGTRQGNASCNNQCCAKNIKHCTGACAADTDPDACITRCTKARNCNEELSCSDYTFNVNPSDSSKCGDAGRGGSACHKECCEQQATFCGCGHNDRDCMKDRGCANNLAAMEIEFTVSNSGVSTKQTHWFADKCKKPGDSCTSTSSCGGHGIATNPGTACCSGTCKDKKADWVQAYYCPEERVCWSQCCNDADCGSGNYCDGGSCHSLKGTGSIVSGAPTGCSGWAGVGQWGGPDVYSKQCKSGYQCSGRCSDCVDNDDCPGSKICLETGPGYTRKCRDKLGYGEKTKILQISCADSGPSAEKCASGCACWGKCDKFKEVCGKPPICGEFGVESTGWLGIPTKCGCKDICGG